MAKYDVLTKERDALDTELKRAEQRKSLLRAMEASEKKASLVEQELALKNEVAKDAPVPAALF